jgi:hypothetical protein
MRTGRARLREVSFCSVSGFSPLPISLFGDFLESLLSYLTKVYPVNRDKGNNDV